MKGRKEARFAWVKWSRMTGRMEREESRSPRLETRRLSLTRIITRISIEIWSQPADCCFPAVELGCLPGYLLPPDSSLQVDPLP